MITLNDLVIGYNKPLMNPLNYTFNDGKIYGVLGKSGCGKSTLLKTIAKMQKPLSGSVARTDKFQIYMMHQRYTNFNWLSCLDNVLIAERNKRYKLLMKIVKFIHGGMYGAMHLITSVKNGRVCKKTLRNCNKTIHIEKKI